MTDLISDAVPVGRIRSLKTAPHQPPLLKETKLPLRSLHLNESPFPPAPSVVAAMQEAAARFNRYPDHEGSALVAALSQRTGIAPARILIGAGSNEIVYASADVSLDQ